jgi:indolepyruvate ferredoxin oxidoreductase, beta subunit
MTALRPAAATSPRSATPAPAVLRELRDAALADEHGEQLQAALERHALA